MDVSVVIPTYNRRGLITRVIEGLSRQSLSSERYEIIVVVDGSTDDTAAALRSLQLPVPLHILEQENRGPAAARNTGFRAAKASLILFLDDDMLPDSGLIAAHLAAHSGSDRTIALGAIFLSSDSPSSLASECFQREIGALHLERRRSAEADWQITDCVFSNTSIRRELLEEVGGFDEEFRMREDLELGARLFHVGVQPRYASNAVTYQQYQKSSADLIRDIEVFAAGDVMFAQKHPEALIRGHLNWLRQKPSLKQRLRRMAARSPMVVDLFLAPMCGLGTIFFRVPALRNMGVRALQIRRSVHWYHKVLELGWRPPGEMS